MTVFRWSEATWATGQAWSFSKILNKVLTVRLYFVYKTK